MLAEAVQDGVSLLSWQQDSFAYADSYDETTDRYRGLRFGQHITIFDDSLPGLLVKPDAAEKQFQAEQATTAGAISGVQPPASGERQTVIGEPTSAVEATRKPKRFYGSVKLDAGRVGRDAGKIAEEIVQHLALEPGATIEVTLDIQADLPEGAPDNLVRTVTENARTLKFTAHGFEKE